MSTPNAAAFDVIGSVLPIPKGFYSTNPVSTTIRSDRTMLMPDIASPGAAIHQTLESGSSSHYLNGAAANDASYMSRWMVTTLAVPKEIWNW